MPQELRRRRCRCGQMFTQTNWRQRRCRDCKPKSPYGRPEPVKLPEAPGLSPEEVRWRCWLLAELEPFEGYGWIRTNDLILYLREQAAKGREDA